MKEKKVLHDSEKRKMLQLSEISLLLDTYDDIFSDFDPRPYSQRAVSDDLLYETKKASRDKVSGMIELKFMVPRKYRHIGMEAIIKKRLREHFKKHAERLSSEIKTMLRQGIMFTCFGIILMFIAAYIMYKGNNKLFTSFMIILLEPASWFLFWEGLRQIVFDSKAKKPEFEFYKKMAKCEISFSSY